MARPYERLPRGARSHLESMASHGLLSESAAAVALGMPLDQFRRVIREHGPSREVWEVALAVERDALLGALYDRAVDGDTSAARTLLATRHGMSEKAPAGGGERVSISFNLPAAMTPEQYAKMVSVSQKSEPLALGGGDDERR